MTMTAAECFTSCPGTLMLWLFSTGANTATESPILTPQPLAQLYTVTAVQEPSRSTRHMENGMPDSGMTVHTTLPSTTCREGTSGDKAAKVLRRRWFSCPLVRTISDNFCRKRWHSSNLLLHSSQVGSSSYALWRLRSAPV
ncbi:hypothetical protein E2C01_007274 [Portunus trituberculatus]|uniref:Secreted protein n=1 Tax=Portunus trituberculatus TaxID=210409 RepID=A0A5B7CXG2_PORTR|nr:hypothetical protein [Portunus trituberculatus]